MKNFLRLVQVMFMALALSIMPCLSIQQSAMALIGNRPSAPIDQPQECENPANCEPGTEQRKPLTNVKIVLRAGHGGKDTGAVWVDRATGVTVKEKDITFQIAERTHRILAVEMGAWVTDVRPNEEFRGLDDSVYLADSSNADLFISIHVNSMPENVTDEARAAAHGIETYWNTPQSQRLAQWVQSSEVNETGAASRGVIQHGYYEVRMPKKCPAILTETGFITNDTERAKLQTPEYQEKIARGIANAVVQYWIEVLRKAGKNATTPASPLPPATDNGNGSQTTPPDTQPPTTTPSTPTVPATPNAPQQPESNVSAKKAQPLKQVFPFNLSPLPVFAPTENIDLSVPASKHFWQRKHTKPSSIKVDLNVGSDEPLEPEQNGLSNDDVF
jgi:N-acetylmuramoyl-L-alanine amidase